MERFLLPFRCFFNLHALRNMRNSFLNSESRPRPTPSGLKVGEYLIVSAIRE